MTEVPGREVEGAALGRCHQAVQIEHSRVLVTQKALESERIGDCLLEYAYVFVFDTGFDLEIGQSAEHAR